VRGVRSSWLVAVLLVAVALAPLLLPEFSVTLANYIGLYALVALGLVLLTGVGGLTRSARQRSSVWVRTRRRCCRRRPPCRRGWRGWRITVAGPARRLCTDTRGRCGPRITDAEAFGHYLPLGTIAWGISLAFLFGTSETLGGHTVSPVCR